MRYGGIYICHTQKPMLLDMAAIIKPTCINMSCQDIKLSSLNKIFSLKACPNLFWDFHQ